MADNTASVVWTGEVRTGSGQVSFDTSQAAGPLDVTFPARAGQESGKTTPEELIAAAHATCYAMALSSALGSGGTPPTQLDTSATVTFSMEGGPHISKIALSVKGVVPDLDAAGFAEAAATAKDGCPVSKLVAGNVEVTLDAELKG